MESATMSLACKCCTWRFTFVRCVTEICFIFSTLFFEILSSTFVAHHGRINFDPWTQCDDFDLLLLVFLTALNWMSASSCCWNLIHMLMSWIPMDFSLRCCRYHSQTLCSPLLGFCLVVSLFPAHYFARFLRVTTFFTVISLCDSM